MNLFSLFLVLWLIFLTLSFILNDEKERLIAALIALCFSVWMFFTK